MRPAPLQSSHTITSAIAEVMSWVEFPQARRRSMRSALRAIARLERQPTEAIALDPRRHIDLIERCTAAELGCRDSTLRNYRSHLRQILRRLGLLASTRIDGEAGTAEWRVLLDQLPNTSDYMRLRGFCAWCSAEGRSPAAVNQATLVAYTSARAAARGGTRAQDHARRVAYLWRQAARLVPSWPRQVLLPVQDQQRGLPLKAYGPGMLEQIERYRRWLAGDVSDDIFDPRNIRPRSASTIETRTICIRRLLFGARERGIPMERLGSLSALTEIDIIKASLRWHLDRKGGKPNADTSQLGGTLVSLAVHLEVEPACLGAIKDIATKVRPRQTNELLARNARLLTDLDDPILRAKLLHVPAGLMADAARLRAGWTDSAGVHHLPRPLEAGRLASIACAIEIELNMPFRIGNLANLRLGTEVQALAGNRNKVVYALRVEAEKVKNRRVLEVQLEGDSARLLRTYIEEYRPLLTHAAGPWLFPGELGADRPRHKDSLGRAMCEEVRQRVGVRMTAHSFRSIVSDLILSKDPHAIDDVRNILGHSGYGTAARHYRRSETQGAARRLAANISGQRQALPAPSGKPGLGFKP